MSDIIPVKIRTARKRHVCDDCQEWIEPGEKYELTVWPPHRMDYMDVDNWLTWKCHWPRNTTAGSFLLGCATSAAYREHAEQEAAAMAGAT